MSSSAFTPTTTQVTTEVPVNVPVVTKDKLFTPIIGISGTFSSQKGEYQRAGNRMNARVQLSFATVSAINSPYTLTLPDSLTYDGSNIPISDEPIVGTFSLWDASASYIEFMGTVHVNSSNSLKFKAHGQTAFNNSSTPVTIAANDILEIQFSIPIAEWAGSGTTTLADRALEEYLSTSSFSSLTINRGPNGSTLPTTTPSGTFESISFGPNPWNTTWLPTDIVSIEVDPFGTGRWTSISGSIEVVSLTVQEASLTYAGLGFYFDGTNWILLRGKYRNPNSTNGTWISTSAGLRYRIKKVSSGAQVGYPISTKNIVGATDGVAPVTGMLGEVVRSQGSTSLSAATGTVNVTSIQIGAGTWILSGFIGSTLGADSITSMIVSDASGIGNTLTGITNGHDVGLAAQSTTGKVGSTPLLAYYTSSPRTIFLNFFRLNSVTATVGFHLSATRIA